MIYGNPSKKHIDAIEQSLLVQQWTSAGILQPLLQMPYPCEITTRAEILSLIARPISQEDIDYGNYVDQYLYEMWSAYIQSLGYTVPVEQLQQWVAPYAPIIDYLKIYYNRPRPFQTAGMFNLPLFPTANHGSTESSYPGGHVLLSLFLYHKLTQLYPAHRRQWLTMVTDVAETRLDLGVHYPSDHLFSFQVYQHLNRFVLGSRT